jgi:ribonuclease R
LRTDAVSQGESPLLEERLPSVAEHCSQTERRAEKAERQLLQWKLVRHLSERVGETFSGRITGVQPFGLFVQLSDYFVDGLVPIRSLGDDLYVFDGSQHRVVGQTRGRTFQLADEVEVVLTGVDLRHRGLDLKLTGMPETRPKRQRRRPVRRRRR